MRLGSLRCKRSRRAGFALVITLLMVAIVAILAIGLMVNASTDRLSARSSEDRYQALLAAQNGLEAAKRALSTDGKGNTISQDDLYLVVRVPSGAAPNPSAEDTTPHYYYIGQATGKSIGTLMYYPLFSGGGGAQTVSNGGLPTFAAPASNVALDVDGKTNLPTLLPDPNPSPTASPQSLIPSPTTQWVDVIDPSATASPAPKLRYCFWIEDLGGYIDADAAGNIQGKDTSGNPNRSHTRDMSIMQPLIDAGTAKPTSLVALWTLLNPNATDSSGLPQQADNQGVVSKRPALFTSETVKQALATANPSTSYLSTISRHVVAGTRRDSEQAEVPYGINARAGPSPAASYADAGTPKLDLNLNIDPSDVNAIADKIGSNLPDWAAGRRGGFPYQATSNSSAENTYRHSIAANMIGYTQTLDKSPVVVAGYSGLSTKPPDYRGLGGYPLVNEFYDYVQWTGASANSVTLNITTWVELWNMSNQTITGTVRYIDYFVHPVTIGDYTYFNAGDDPKKPGKNGSSSTVTGLPFATQMITMAPNELRVINFGTANYTLYSGKQAPPPTLVFQYNLNSNYTLEWQATGANSSFVQVDSALGGVQRSKTTITTASPYEWGGSLPGFVYTTGPTNNFYSPGDPRVSVYASASQLSSDYSSDSTMWYRNQKPGSTQPQAKAVKPSAWPDTGHDTTLGKAGSKDTVPPATSAPSGANTEPTKAPMVISGLGILKSITELGNIYDPAQWNIPLDSNNHWSDISPTTTADSRYRGRLHSPNWA